MILHKISHRDTIFPNWIGFKLVYETQKHFFCLSLDDQNKITGIYDSDKNNMKDRERREYRICLGECYEVCAVMDLEFKLGDDMSKFIGGEK